MGLKLTPNEVQNIFSSIDFDFSGSITFPEFYADFEKVVATDIQSLIMDEKDRVAADSNNMS
jgi:Ca2+-binding EF-hand superfamily protein